jgi:DNA mismatch endonuclease (patch repair protein)
MIFEDNKMPRKRPKEVVSFNMSKIRSKGTKLEATLEGILRTLPGKYSTHPKVFGKPDFAYLNTKIAIFADSDFWHGFNWEKKKLEIKTNKEFWLNKIEKNILRDKEVTDYLQQEDWKVVRLWGHEILKEPDKCKALLEETLKTRCSG